MSSKEAQGNYINEHGMAESSAKQPHKLSRRDFLKGSATVVGGLAVQHFINEHFEERETLKPFPPDQIGVNINTRSIRSFDLDIEKTLDQMLALPGKHVRIPVPFNEVATKRRTYNYSSVDRIVDKALRANKLIEIQFGAKTFGYPEVHIPNWITEKYPYLNKDGVALDRSPEVQEYILEYLDRVAARYLPIKEIESIHVENEGLLKHVEVARDRHVSYEFYMKELEVVKSYDENNRPIVQNVSISDPSDLLDFAGTEKIISSSNTIALNIYNQYNSTWVPDTVFRTWLWDLVKTRFQQAKAQNKNVIVSEYQTSEWIDKHKQNRFDWEYFLNGLIILQKLKPKVIYLWDVEQVFWRAHHQENEEGIELLQSLVLNK